MKWKPIQTFKNQLHQGMTLLGLNLLWLFNQSIPFRWQLAIGRALGSLLYWILPRRRHIARSNITRCLRITDPNALQHLLRNNFRSFGQGLIETGFAWFGDTKRLKKHVRFLGHGNLEAALAHGKGLILIGTHFHSLDLFGRLFAQEHAIVPTYRRMKNPWVNAWMEKARETYFPQVIERRETRAMVRALQKNAVLWMAPDQDYGPKHSLFAPFFNVPTATITSLVKLAQITGAKVAMINTKRLPKTDPCLYELHVLPYFDPYPTGDLLTDTAQMNQAIENLILQDPSQYLWQHRRFKTRPPGEPSFYDFSRQPTPIKTDTPC